MSAFTSDFRRTLGSAVALSIAYYAGVRVGFVFTVEPNAISLLWPPNAIVLAALLLNRPRRWGWLLVAVLPAHLIAELRVGVPLAMALGWYLSNITEALLGAIFIKAVLGRPPRFSILRDASVFLVGAVFMAPVLSSFLDAALVAVVDWRYEGNYWQVWRMRTFSNALATVMLVPIIVTAGNTTLRSLRDAVFRRGIEATVLLTLLALISWFVFHRSYSVGEAATYVYAPLPLLVWAALRLGAGGVAACIGIVALISIAGELRGLGPFVRAGAEVGVRSLQIFLIIAASSLTLLAAALAELSHARAMALRRKQRLDLALAAARMGVWEWDLRLDTIKWRMAPQKKGTEMSSTALLELVHADDRGALSGAMNMVRSGTEVAEYECRLVIDQSERWIMSKGKILHTRGGEPRRVIGIFSDTTRRKRQEVHERSQRELLAHLSRVSMLGELSGALTHELSQPIAAVLFNAQTALREINQPSPNMGELTAILEDIVADDTRAGEVIRRLRALFIRGSVQKESVDVCACIHAVLKLENTDLIVRGVATEIQIAEDLPMVSVDPVQIQQVLLNLIVNACESMEAVSVDQRQLCISVCREQGSTVHIRVCDSGPGIEHPDRIFEPFFSTKTRGIGLGLAICRSIIRAHGGQLWGTNNAGRGATFHVSLPVVTASAKSSDSQPLPS